jgi:serine/threonine-protein kinase
VHRDVKPGNIVIEERTGRPVLLDLGLVKGASDDIRQTEIVGSPPYMAPEQIAPFEDTEVLTSKVDVYALGCTAFELLTATLPYEAASTFLTMNLHLNAPIPRLSSRRAGLEDLDEVLVRAMAKHPRGRADSALDLANAFDAALARRTLPERPPPRFLTPPPTRSGPPVGFAATLPAPPERHRVLVIDDDSSVRQVVTRALQRAFPGSALDIVSAASGIDGVRAATEHPPQLVLIDYDMPGMNGVETLASLRRLDGSKHAPAIVVTGHPEEEVRWRFELLGISEFLSKPVTFDSLIPALQRCEPGWT